MNRIHQIYGLLLKEYGAQGWWPVTPSYGEEVVPVYGIKTRTERQRLEIIVGCILAQNTQWFPNVVKAIVQLNLGRALGEQEWAAIKSRMSGGASGGAMGGRKDDANRGEIKEGGIASLKEQDTAADMVKIASRRFSQRFESPQAKACSTRRFHSISETSPYPQAQAHSFRLTSDIKKQKRNSLISIDRLLSIKKEKLAGLIRSAGYYNQKAERLKSIVEFLSKNPEPDREQLLAIKGVGPETADSILLYACKKPFFVIDAYTKRIFERMGYGPMSYGGWQKIFIGNLPEDEGLFNDYHALLVKLGKEHCRKRPVCGGCPVKRMCQISVGNSLT